MPSYYILQGNVKWKIQTWDRGKISARRCLYLLTGCLDLARKAGQKQQRLSQTGNTVLETTPIDLYSRFEQGYDRAFYRHMIIVNSMYGYQTGAKEWDWDDQGSKQRSIGICEKGI